jgi:hypothetical protein
MAEEASDEATKAAMEVDPTGTAPRRSLRVRKKPARKSTGNPRQGVSYKRALEEGLEGQEEAQPSKKAKSIASIEAEKVSAFIKNLEPALVKLAISVDSSSGLVQIPKNVDSLGWIWDQISNLIFPLGNEWTEMSAVDLKLDRNYLYKYLTVEPDQADAFAKSLRTPANEPVRQGFEILFGALREFTTPSELVGENPPPVSPGVGLARLLLAQEWQQASYSTEWRSVEPYSRYKGQIIDQCSAPLQALSPNDDTLGIFLMQILRICAKATVSRLLACPIRKQTFIEIVRTYFVDGIKAVERSYPSSVEKRLTKAAGQRKAAMRQPHLFKPKPSDYQMVRVLHKPQVLSKKVILDDSEIAVIKKINQELLDYEYYFPRDVEDSNDIANVAHNIRCNIADICSQVKAINERLESRKTAVHDLLVTADRSDQNAFEGFIKPDEHRTFSSDCWKAAIRHFFSQGAELLPAFGPTLLTTIPATAWTV